MQTDNQVVFHHSSRAPKNVDPKNVPPEMLGTPQPQVMNGGVGFLAEFGIQCLRTCYKNAARLLKNKNGPG